MPAAHHDYVTGSEFKRWMDEESQFRERLERRMSEAAQAVQLGLSKIETHLSDINGRTRKNTEAVAVIEREIEAIKSEDEAIDKALTRINQHGCGQLHAHQAVLRDLGWSPRRKAAVAGGLIGSGALMWPALQRIAEAVRAIVEHAP